MSSQELIRQWKDPSARAGGMLSHPAGEIVLEEEAVGAMAPPTFPNNLTYACCTTALETWCGYFPV